MPPASSPPRNPPGPRDPLVERLADGATVITATARLARELGRRFDRRQLALGREAWESADALPWNAWLQRTWRDLGARRERLPTLLNELQVAALWQDIIGGDIRRRARADQPLWNLHATARTAVGAWRILNAWRIDLEACAASPQEDHRCLVRWARRYRRRCAENNWTDPYCLADRLRDAAGDDARFPDLFAGPVVITGFDHLLPQQQSLIETLKDHGVAIETAPPEVSVNQTVARRRYPDQTTQWLSAARWAREKLLDNPEARLAIVAPDLNQSAPAIEYALQQLLCPQRLIEPAPSARLPYHLSLGQPLSRHPLAAAALTALAPMSGAPLTAEALGRLIRSPFIRGADREATARAKLELWCRQRLPWQIRPRKLVAALPDADNPGPRCPILGDALNAALPLLEDRGARPAAHWAEHFGKWLEGLGWPGERGLDSDEFQAERAFRRQLRNLALLDLTTPPMSAAAALGWLRRRVDEQPFQVEARDAPVQVLGILEAAGQQFDGIWFGGLVEARWPPALRTNPFIAARLQRQAGIFEASLEDGREHAAAQQRRLIASGREVILARPQTVDDVPAEPSPLLDDPGAHGNAEDAGDAETSHFDTPAALLHAARPELPAFTDRRGPAWTGGAAGGGVSLIENQAKCPFRAFAIHRLGARRSEPNEQGLGPAERGSLIHRALQLAWEQIPGSRELRALAPEQLRRILHDAADQAARRYRVSSGCGDRFHQAQARWARDTLAEWFEVEMQRPGEFVVAAREQQTELDLDGLHLSFKIDRMDRLDHMKNDHLVLIDYKTGVPAGLTGWSGARPRAPQLPLYALAQEAPVAAVAHGRVRRGNCGLSGVARDSGFTVGVNPLEESGLKRDFADWDELMAHWRAVLSELAREFLDGEARVDPLNPDVCAHCDLHGLCRVSARPEAPGEARSP